MEKVTWRTTLLSMVAIVVLGSIWWAAQLALTVTSFSEDCIHACPKGVKEVTWTRCTCTEYCELGKE